MYSARTIIGNYCYRMSTNYILGKSKLIDIKQLIMTNTIKLLHKVYILRQPQSLVTHYKPITSLKTLNTKHKATTRALKQFYLHKGAIVFNNLDDNLKEHNPKIFTKKIQKNNTLSGIWDTKD